VHRSQGMLETGVVGPGIDKVRHAELTNPSKSLKKRVLYKMKNDLVPDLDEAVYRVIDDLVFIDGSWFHEVLIDRQK
jgi:hypothetical protein